MTRTLVIGFGNAYRRDDGVGYVVINALRDRLGRPLLDPDDDGYNDLGHPIDTLLLHQLVPELAADLAHYALVVFVDAHMGTIPEPIRQEELTACYKAATVSHQVHPCTLLATAQELYGHAPRGILLSIRGHDFEFGEGLSPATQALVPEAVDRLGSLASGAE
jgi:hydrogenase maturation protease